MNQYRVYHGSKSYGCTNASGVSSGGGALTASVAGGAGGSRRPAMMHTSSKVKPDMARASAAPETPSATSSDSFFQNEPRPDGGGVGAGVGDGAGAAAGEGEGAGEVAKGRRAGQATARGNEKAAAKALFAPKDFAEGFEPTAMRDDWLASMELMRFNRRDLAAAVGAAVAVRAPAPPRLQKPKQRANIDGSSRCDER
jgi:hypothetical protein